MVISFALIGLPSENLFSFYAFLQFRKKNCGSIIVDDLSFRHSVRPSVRPYAHMCSAHNLIIWSQI